MYQNRIVLKYQTKCVTLYQYNNVLKSPDSNVNLCHLNKKPNRAEVFQDNNVIQFLNKNAEQYQSKFENVFCNNMHL